MGMHFQAYGLLDASEPCYRNAQQLASDDWRWAYYLADVSRQNGDLDQADGEYRRALELRPDYLPAWVRLGRLELETDRPEPARRSLERAMELDPACAAAMVGLGLVESREKNHADALAWFERALALVPDATNLHFHIAMAHRGLGDLDTAARHMERRGEVKVGVADPLIDELQQLATGVRPFTDLASRLGRSGRYDEAVEVLSRAIASDPSDPIAHLYMGLALTKKGELEAGLAAFRKVIELMPDNERAHLYSGSILSAAGKDLEALAHFREAVRLHPELVSARMELARTLQRIDDHQAALEHYERAVALEPGNAEARLGRAFARIRLERFSEARSGLEEDVVSLPDEPAFEHALARLLAAAPDDSLRDGARALAITEELSRSMKNLDLAETVGMALAEGGRWEEAVRWQSSLLELARQSGEPTRVARVARNLALYRTGQACREPWVKDDPVFVPARARVDATVPAMPEAPVGDTGQPG
jgi:protein O-GlcNAc transferase